jgi:hypothetical protein
MELRHSQPVNLAGRESGQILQSNPTIGTKPEFCSEIISTANESRQLYGRKIPG